MAKRKTTAPRAESLTDVQIWIAYERYNYNKGQAAEALGIPVSTFKDRLVAVQARLGVSPKSLGTLAGTEATPTALPRGKGIKRYILTCAQNNTLAHKPTWQSLLHLADHWGATIKVSTFTYVVLQEGSQKRGAAAAKTNAIWYDPALVPYIADTFEQLAPGLVWCGHANTLPTASDPLTGTESMNGRNSGVWPHTTIQMRSIATMHGDPPKLNYTTGAITLRNYIQKRAGIRAEFHHSYGALLVEVTADGAWWCRHLNADSEGVIHDIGIHADPKGVWETEGGVEALVYGDIHEQNIDKGIEEATWGAGRLRDVLKPRVEVFHDLLDFESRSHHTARNPHERYRLHVERKESVAEEVRGAGVFLDMLAVPGTVQLVVSSNHDRHLDRWLRETDWRDDLVNAEFYLDAQQATLAAIRRGSKFDTLAWAFKHFGVGCNATLLELDESYVVLKKYGGGVELGLHGDLGPNGSRGSPKNLGKLGRKAVIGHSHSPGIWDGVYVAGVTGKLEQGYNTGPSSWAHAHVVVYPNSKRQVLVGWKNAFSAEDYLTKAIGKV